MFKLGRRVAVCYASQAYRSLGFLCLASVCLGLNSKLNWITRCNRIRRNATQKRRYVQVVRNNYNATLRPCWASMARATTVLCTSSVPS